MWNWPCQVTKCKVKQNNRMSERRIWLQNESLAESTRIEQWRNVIRSWEPRICASFLFAFFWNSHTISSRTLAVKKLNGILLLLLHFCCVCGGEIRFTKSQQFILFTVCCFTRGNLFGVLSLGMPRLAPKLPVDKQNRFLSEKGIILIK